MYEVDSDKFTSKPNPKREFAIYFKESGAAAALQKAMLLLYRMPVKPTNLAEFFSQYFENGAQQLTRISLLKAELCYKRDELQNKTLKVQESEICIKNMIDSLGISEDDFNSIFVPEQIKEEHLTIIERYIKEMDGKVLGPEDAVPNLSNIAINTEVAVEQDIDYDFENNCLKNVRSDNALKEDIKELDPWGIICKGSKSRRSEDGKRSTNFSQDIYVSSEIRASRGDEEHEPDDDDATSLAELFQQSSTDWITQNHDENAVKLHNRLLTVKKADRIRMSEFFGWTPLQSREDLTNLVTKAVESEREATSTQIDKESLYRRPCSQRGAGQLMFQSSLPTNVNPKEPDNDAFLLEENHLEHAHKLRESTQQSFEYEFQRWSREARNVVTAEICEPLCEVADISHICSANKTAESDGFLYGEDESQNESLGFVPGKMANWTSQYTDYPLCSSRGEYYEFGGENDDFHSCDDTSRFVENSKRKKSLTEVPMTRIDSSCHCMLTGLYNAGDMYDENNDETNEHGSKNDQANTSLRRSKSKKGRPSLQKDEATITDDSVLENELFEVFKQKQNRKSLKKDKNEIETEEPSHTVDVFGIDLAKEVKRAFLGYASDEVQQPTFKGQYATQEKNRHRPSALQDTGKMFVSNNQEF